MMALTSIDLLGDVTRLTGVLSLLAAYGFGRGGRWTRARQKRARETFVVPRAGDADARRSVSALRTAHRLKRHDDTLRFGFALFWLAVLLSFLAYAEVCGDAGLVELQALGTGVLTD